MSDNPYAARVDLAVKDRSWRYLLAAASLLSVFLVTYEVWIRAFNAAFLVYTNITLP